MKLKILILLIVSSMLLNCSVQKPLKFTLLGTNKEHTSENNDSKWHCIDSYIIENYHNNTYCARQIDSFAYQQGKLKKDSFVSYTLDFYKASDKTNLEHLKETPRDLDRYSNVYDYIYNYRWSNGTFSGKTKYKNGKIVNPKSTVIIKDAPPLKQ